MKKIYADVVGWFEQNMPLPKPELHFDSPWQLLVAVMLSAQCTDKRVNMVTPALFEAFPTAENMATASFETTLLRIYSLTTKAGNGADGRATSPQEPRLADALAAASTPCGRRRVRCTDFP